MPGEAPHQRVKALLLAAGPGTRLRPLTNAVPKCLVPVAGRPLLDYWFEALERAEVRDVLVNTHHLPELMRDFLRSKIETGSFRVREAFEPELLGSAGTVAANADWMDDGDQALVIYTDNLSTVDLGELLRFHSEHGAPVTMVLFRARDPRSAGIVELDEQGRVVAFVEKPRRPRSDLANAGIYALTADAWRKVAELGAFDFGHDVLPHFVGSMRGWFPNAYHRDIGTPESLAEAEREAVAGFQPPPRLEEEGG